MLNEQSECHNNGLKMIFQQYDTSTHLGNRPESDRPSLEVHESIPKRPEAVIATKVKKYCLLNMLVFDLISLLIKINHIISFYTNFALVVASGLINYMYVCE